MAPLPASLLPGGLYQNGERRRDYRFHPVDGALEMAILEVADTASSTPAAVTAALCRALDEVCGGSATPERIRQLCVADRQYLMRALAIHLGERDAWLSADCSTCSESFDFHLDFRQLPTEAANEPFPELRVELAGKLWQFRLPTGGDQEALVGSSDPLALLQRCLLEPKNEPLSKLKQPQLEQIDQALDAASPGVVTEVQAPCPQCGHDNRVTLNPYSFLGRPKERLLTEVHQVALHYHWSERDILALPQERRNAYLRLIDRARGMTQ